MAVAKVAVSMDQDLVVELDRLVDRQVFASRSQAVQAAVREKIARLKRHRLAEECAKLDPEYERSLAEEGCRRSWPNGPNTERRHLLGRSDANSWPRTGRRASGARSDLRYVQREIGNGDCGGDHQSAAASRFSAGHGDQQREAAQAIVGQNKSDSHPVHLATRQEVGPRFFR